MSPLLCIYSMEMTMTTKAFYDEVRQALFYGKFTTSQMVGMDSIIAACKDLRLNRQGAAYCLATAYHETGTRMVPVREGFAKDDRTAIQIVTLMFNKGRISTNYALPDKITGKSYYGRGLVQLTWKRNYVRAGNALDLDLVNNPSMLLDPMISAQVLVRGMRDGWFTGVSLDDVSEPLTSDPDFTNDRRIVNGTDRAEDIAVYADKFYRALKDVDLLQDSRTIKAVKKQRSTSLVGQISVGAGAVATGIHEALGEPISVVGAAGAAANLSQYLPWAAGGLALVGIVSFIWVKILSKRIESARREDNELKGT